jgi:hypothetical protein
VPLCWQILLVVFITQRFLEKPIGLDNKI